MAAAPMSDSASLPAESGRFFTGFTKLCKGLAVILFLGHISIQIFPSAATYLTLIPARTIPFGWNLITAGYIEQTIPGAILDPIASIFHKLLCGQSEGKGQALDALLPSSESVMSNRRRERGHRALEQRLAEKLAAVKSSEGTPVQEDASGRV